MKILKLLAIALFGAALCSCSKTPVACADLSPTATTDLIVQHFKSGFTNTEARNALEVAIKPPADFSKLVVVASPVVETSSQAPDGNSANCAAHFEATAAPDIQKSAARWKGEQGTVRGLLALAGRSQAGDEVGDDGYFQFAARKLVGSVKVLKEYAEVVPGEDFLPPSTFKGTLKYVLTRGEGQERKYAITADAVGPKWAQALTIYGPLDEFASERTKAAERKQAYGAFEVLAVKKAEMCGDEALCVSGDRKQFILNAAALKKDALDLLSEAAKKGSDVCLTGVEKSDGRLLASGVVQSCQ